MSIASNPMRNAESAYRRIECINRELSMCATFTALAAMKYEAGNRSSAERSLSHAEQVYIALLPFVLDPAYSNDLTREQVQDFAAELERLREGLDRLQRFRK